MCAGWKACKSLTLLPILRYLLGQKLRFVHLLRHGATMMLSDNHVQLKQSCMGGGLCGSAKSSNTSGYGYDDRAAGLLHSECLHLQEQTKCRTASCGTLKMLSRQAHLWTHVNLGVRAAAYRAGPAVHQIYRSVRIEDFVRGIGVASLLQWVGCPPASLCARSLNATCWREPLLYDHLASACFSCAVAAEEGTVTHMLEDKFSVLVSGLARTTACARVSRLYAQLGNGCNDARFRGAMVEFGYWELGTSLPAVCSSSPANALPRSAELVSRPLNSF